MKKEIVSVNTEPNLWEGKHGTLAFITVTFADGDQGSVACKPDNVDRVIGILEGLERKGEFEFGLEPKDDYQGIAQWKVKAYPGKPGQQDGSGGSPQRSAGGSFSGRKSSPEDRSSIEAQVAAKIAGELAVALIGKGELPIGKAIDYVTSATYLIDRAISSAATEKSGSAVDRPSGGPLSPPGPDEAEGDAPASPSGWGETKNDAGPATAKQKAKANLLFGSAGKLMIAAKAMFPEVTKVGDLTEDQMAALIEDKESA